MNRERLERIKDPILSEPTIVKKTPKKWYDPLYMDMELPHKWHKVGSKKDKYQKSAIRMDNIVRKLYDHYGGGGDPHCVVCGNTDQRVLCLHHVHGRKKYPVEWGDIVKEGFPGGWLKPLCANHHRIEHSVVKWEPIVYSKHN